MAENMVDMPTNIALKIMWKDNLVNAHRFLFSTIYVALPNPPQRRELPYLRGEVLHRSRDQMSFIMTVDGLLTAERKSVPNRAQWSDISNGPLIVCHSTHETQTRQGGTDVCHSITLAFRYVIEMKNSRLGIRLR